MEGVRSDAGYCWTGEAQGDMKRPGFEDEVMKETALTAGIRG